MITPKSQINTRVSSVKLTEDNLILIDVKPNESFEQDDVVELINAVYKLGNGKQYKHLITVGEYTMADIQALKLCSSQEGSKYKLAAAFVISTLAQRMLGNFCLNVIRPVKPTKFFTDREEAEN